MQTIIFTPNLIFFISNSSKDITLKKVYRERTRVVFS